MNIKIIGTNVNDLRINNVWVHQLLIQWRLV